MTTVRDSSNNVLQNSYYHSVLAPNNQHSFIMSDFVQLRDGRLFQTGGVRPFGNVSPGLPQNPLVIEYSESGQVLSRTYYTPNADSSISWAEKIDTTLHGGFFIGGNSQIDTFPGIPNERVFVSRLDSALNVIWTRHFYTSTNIGLKELTSLQDGSVILAIINYNLPGSRFLRIDSLGSVVWDKTYSGFDISGMDRRDSTIGVCGYSSLNLLAQGFFAQLDYNGDLHHTKCFGGIAEERLECISALKSGGFILGGGLATGPPGGSVLLKFTVIVNDTGQMISNRVHPQRWLPNENFHISSFVTAIDEADDGAIYASYSKVYYDTAGNIPGVYAQNFMRLEESGDGCYTFQYPVQTHFVTLGSLVSPLNVRWDTIQTTSLSPANIILDTVFPTRTLCHGGCLVDATFSWSGGATLGDTVQLSYPGNSWNNFTWTITGPNVNIQTVTNANPQFVPAAPGVYVMSLELQDTACADVYRDTILLCGPLGAAFSDTSICANAVIPLNIPSGMNQFSWSTGDTVAGIMAGIGTYSYSGTDTAGCIQTDTIFIDTLPAQQVTIHPDTSTCSNSGIVFSAPPGAVNPVWNNSISGIVFSPTPGTTFYEGQDNDGCWYRDTIVWNVYPPQSIQLGADTTLCPGDSLTLTAPGWLTNPVWSGGQTGSQATYSQAGTILLSGNDTNGCPREDSLALDYYVVPPGTLLLDTLCPGDSLSFSPGAGAVSWTWSTGQVGGTLTVTQPGVFWVEETLSNGGCTRRDSISVNSTPYTLSILGNSAFCAGDSVLLTASSNYSGHLWNGSPSGSQIWISQPGPVSLIATDLFGCMDTAFQNLQIDSVEAGFGAFPFGNTVTFFDSSQGALQWNWDFGDGSTATVANPIHTFSGTNFFVCLTVTSALGCMDTECDSLILVMTPDGLNPAQPTLSPNPSEGRIVLTLPELISGTWTVFDSQGRAVLNLDPMVKGPNRVYFSGLQPGIWLLKADEHPEIQLKFVIVR